MTPSVNIGYIIVHAFAILTNFPVDVSSIPGAVVFFVESIMILGMVVSMVLLVLLVYTRIRLVQVEHHGFHLREEEEHVKRVLDVRSAKNPRWEGILTLSNSPSESDWRRAILEADILLAAVLTDNGYVGATLGDQLKMANPLQFTTVNLAWEAHKIRNAIAHLGEGFPLTERDTRTTIDQYRQVFEEFDYI